MWFCRDSLYWLGPWLQFRSFFMKEALKNYVEVWSQVCLAKICVWMVLIEALYLEKLCGVICLVSAWILYASLKENKEWGMLVVCRFHTWAVEGGLRAQGGFTIFMNQMCRAVCSVLENVVCLFVWVGLFVCFGGGVVFPPLFFFNLPISPLLPKLLQAFLWTGCCYMFWIF